MQFFNLGSEEYIEARAVTDKVLSAEQWPRYRFNDKDWVLSYLHPYEGVTSNKGGFHDGLAMFLKDRGQHEYYLICTDVVSFSRSPEYKVHHVPVAQLTTSDSRERYLEYWKAKNADTDMPFGEIGFNYLCVGKEADWFVLIDTDLYLTICGCKTNSDMQLLIHHLRDSVFIDVQQAMDLCSSALDKMKMAAFIANYTANSYRRND